MSGSLFETQCGSPILTLLCCQWNIQLTAKRVWLSDSMLFCIYTRPGYCCDQWSSTDRKIITVCNQPHWFTRPYTPNWISAYGL